MSDIFYCECGQEVPLGTNVKVQIEHLKSRKHKKRMEKIELLTNLINEKVKEAIAQRDSFWKMKINELQKFIWKEKSRTPKTPKAILVSYIEDKLVELQTQTTQNPEKN